MATRKPSMMTIRKYSRDMPSIVFEMASKNMTRTAICSRLGITLENFRQFLEKYQEFANAYKLGKETFREEMIHSVEEQMYSSIVPKKKEKVTNYYMVDKDGNQVLSHVTRETRDGEVDTSLLKFIAKNLDPEKWGDQKPMDTGGETLQLQGKEWAEYIMQSCGVDNIADALHIEDRHTDTRLVPADVAPDEDVVDVTPAEDEDDE